MVHVAGKVVLSKIAVDGKRPGDSFHRAGEGYRVVAVRMSVNPTVEYPVYVTESRHGREVWF